MTASYLAEQLDAARRAGDALQASLDRLAGDLPLPEELTQDQQVELEALTARFARLADILLQKVFRAIDAAELEDEGSLIDRLNRAEKRGLVDSAADWRQIRELRNQVAHEYVLADLRELFDAALKHAPTLLETLERCQAHAPQR